jgi:hypothetical protein
VLTNVSRLEMNLIVLSLTLVRRGCFKYFHKVVLAAVKVEYKVYMSSLLRRETMEQKRGYKK